MRDDYYMNVTCSITPQSESDDESVDIGTDRVWPQKNESFERQTKTRIPNGLVRLQLRRKLSCVVVCLIRGAPSYIIRIHAIYTYIGSSSQSSATCSTTGIRMLSNFPSAFSVRMMGFSCLIRWDVFFLFFCRDEHDVYCITNKKKQQLLCISE